MVCQCEYGEITNGSDREGRREERREGVREGRREERRKGVREGRREEDNTSVSKRVRESMIDSDTEFSVTQTADACTEVDRSLPHSALRFTIQ